VSSAFELRIISLIIFLKVFGAFFLTWIILVILRVANVLDPDHFESSLGIGEVGSDEDLIVYRKKSEKLDLIEIIILKIINFGEI
jgi:hypothetical protein